MFDIAVRTAVRAVGAVRVYCGGRRAAASDGHQAEERAHKARPPAAALRLDLPLLLAAGICGHDSRCRHHRRSTQPNILITLTSFTSILI